MVSDSSLRVEEYEIPLSLYMYRLNVNARVAMKLEAGTKVTI